MNEERKTVNVTAADVEAVRTRLTELHAELSESQQAVVEWLLLRAAQAPEEEVTGYLAPGASQLSGPQFTGRPGLNFNAALGISQFQGLNGFASRAMDIGTIRIGD